MNILDQILATKRIEMSRAREHKSYDTILAEAQAVMRPVISFSRALATSESSIIAEFKRRSPSKGFIKEGADVTQIVSDYVRNGATAISVLTDNEYFGGSLDDLIAARKVADIPILRKDFIIDPYQICEARIAGADVILLIAAALTTDKCHRLAEFARSLGLEVLLEVHNEAETALINEYVNVVGVNNRDLATFITDIAVSKSLFGLIPDTYIRISESGISSPKTVKELRKQGFRGFLMGENFMKEKDPGTALRMFIEEI